MLLYGWKIMPGKEKLEEEQQPKHRHKNKLGRFHNKYNGIQPVAGA